MARPIFRAASGRVGRDGVRPPPALSPASRCRHGEVRSPADLRPALAELAADDGARAGRPAGGRADRWGRHRHGQTGAPGERHSGHHELHGGAGRHHQFAGHRQRGHGQSGADDDAAGGRLHLEQVHAAVPGGQRRLLALRPGLAAAFLEGLDLLALEVDRALRHFAALGAKNGRLIGIEGYAAHRLFAGRLGGERHGADAAASSDPALARAINTHAGKLVHLTRFEEVPNVLD